MPTSVKENWKMFHSVCLEPCLWIGEFLEWCKPFQCEETADACELFTWKPENSDYVYLIKILGFTLAYVPCRDMVYFVNPVYGMNNQCPANTMFACQYVKDPGQHPRLLVFDILYEKGKHLNNTSVKERYAKVLEHQKYFAPSTCVVQWCGERSALTADFLSSLPHKCDSIIGLGSIPGFIHVEKQS